MNLYSKEEICQGCDFAVFHDCCKSLCRCMEQRIEELDYYDGRCKYYFRGIK